MLCVPFAGYDEEETVRVGVASDTETAWASDTETAWEPAMQRDPTWDGALVHVPLWHAYQHAQASVGAQALPCYIRNPNTPVYNAPLMLTNP